jgi:hypothetical protein
MAGCWNQASNKASTVVSFGATLAPALGFGAMRPVAVLMARRCATSASSASEKRPAASRSSQRPAESFRSRPS